MNRKALERIAMMLVLSLVASLTLGLAMAQNPGGMLRIGQITDLVNLDPHEIGQSDGAFKWQVFDTLLRMEKDLTPTSAIAEAWEFSDDGLTLTFQLRDGLMFHNGDEVTSEDIAFNIRRVQDPETGSKLRANSLAITSIETPDASTLVVGFDEPAPTIFDFFGRLWIGAPEMFEDSSTAIGTGPFRFVEWIPGDHVTLERYEDYWRESLPYLDGVEIRVLPDKESLVANLQAGAIDVARLIPLTSLETLEGDPRFDVVVSDSASNYYALGFVVTSPPLDDPLVRRALNLTVPRERFVEVFQQGAGEPTCVPWPKSSPAFDTEQDESCRQDLEAAAEMLEEAGLGDGFDLTLEISREITPDSVRLVQVWQQELASLGIDLEIEEVSAAVWKEKKANAEFKQIWADLFGNTNRNPAAPFLQARPFLPDTNPSRYQSERYDELVAALGSETDAEAQQELYREITDLLLEEAFINPVTYQPQIWAMDASIVNFEVDINDKDILERTYFQD